MKRILTRAVLAGSGTLLGLIGGALLFAPKAFLEMSHVFVKRDASLMSELSAPSGILLIACAVMILGTIRIKHADLALLVGAIVYGGYGMGRLISIGLHGVPSESLLTATIIELGVAATLVALRQRQIANTYIGGAIV